MPADARRRQAHGYRNKNRRTVLFRERESDGGSAVKPGPLWALTRPSGVGLLRAARCPADKRGKKPRYSPRGEVPITTIETPRFPDRPHIVAQFCVQVRKIAIRITMTAITAVAVFVSVTNVRYVCS